MIWSCYRSQTRDHHIFTSAGLGLCHTTLKEFTFRLVSGFPHKYTGMNFERNHPHLWLTESKNLRPR